MGYACEKIKDIYILPLVRGGSIGPIRSHQRRADAVNVKVITELLWRYGGRLRGWTVRPVVYGLAIIVVTCHF